MQAEHPAAPPDPAGGAAAEPDDGGWDEWVEDGADVADALLFEDPAPNPSGGAYGHAYSAAHSAGAGAAQAASAAAGAEEALGLGGRRPFGDVTDRFASFYSSLVGC